MGVKFDQVFRDASNARRNVLNPITDNTNAQVVQLGGLGDFEVAEKVLKEEHISLQSAFDRSQASAQAQSRTAASMLKEGLSAQQAQQKSATPYANAHRRYSVHAQIEAENQREATAQQTASVQQINDGKKRTQKR